MQDSARDDRLSSPQTSSRRERTRGSVPSHARTGFTMPYIFGVPLPVVILAVVVVIAIAFGASQLVGSLTSGGSGSSDDTGKSAEPEEVDTSSEYAAVVSSLDALVDPGESVATATLQADQGKEAPTLIDESKQRIEDAIAAIANNGDDVGCALLDLQTGNAIVYSIDTSVYGASSFKGPYCVYLAQAKLESGALSQSSIEERVENAIVWSDNDSYESLRHSNKNAELATWLESLSIDSSVASDSDYPHYTPRDSLRLWMNSYQYLFSGDSTEEYTDWLKSLFSDTRVSFMRDGITAASQANTPTFDFDIEVTGDVSDSASYTQRLMNRAANAVANTLADEGEVLTTEVTVYDKAGWIASTHYDSDVDAGIIQENDNFYLMTIMTGQRDSDTSRANVSNVALALWQAHDELGSEESDDADS